MSRNIKSITNPALKLTILSEQDINQIHMMNIKHLDDIFSLNLSKPNKNKKKTKRKPIKKTSSKTSKSSKTKSNKTKHVKKSKNYNIPKAIRDEVWRKYFGNCKDGKCLVCNCEITDLNFECGHNKPKSKGGNDTISNLLPICRSCNLGMGNRYTILEYKNNFYPDKNYMDVFHL